MLRPGDEWSGPDTKDNGDEDTNGNGLAGKEGDANARVLAVVVRVERERPAQVEEGRNRRRENRDKGQRRPTGVNGRRQYRVLRVKADRQRGTRVG